MIEGTRDPEDGPETTWQAYEFPAKPGDPKRRPPQIAPYHLRLDWLMWFLPLRAMIDDGGVVVPGYERWFVALVGKLLDADPGVRGLLRHDPFGDRPPARIRARAVRYRFSDRVQRKQSGAWWICDPVGEFLPAVTRGDLGEI